MNKNWHATGWRCATGRAIEYSLFLAAGTHARVFRDGKRWRYIRGRFFWSKGDASRPFNTRTAAMKACEAIMEADLRTALRQLRGVA